MSGWGKAENKAKLSPAGTGSWAELGNKYNILLNCIFSPNYLLYFIVRFRSTNPTEYKRILVTTEYYIVTEY